MPDGKTGCIGPVVTPKIVDVTRNNLGHTTAHPLPVTGALVLLSLGAGVLAGWFTGAAVLADWGVPSAPAPASGALGLMLFALALLGRDRLGRRWAAVGALPALAGAWSLLARWALLPAGLSAWLGRHGLDQMVTTGRMGLVTAVSFLLAGGVLASLAGGRPTRQRVLLLATIGSLVGAAGLSAILGHATGLEVAATLGGKGALALPMAAGVLVLGACLVALGVEERPDRERPARWLPVPLMLGCLAVTLILWGGLVRRDRLQERTAAELRADAIAAALAAELEGPLKALNRIAVREAVGAEYTPRLRQTDAQGVMRQFPEVLRVGWLDAALRPTQTWSATAEATTGVFEHLGEPRRRAALERARATSRMELLAPEAGPDGQPGVLAYVAFRRGDSEGYLVAQISAAAWAERALGRLPTMAHSWVAVALGTVTIHGQFAAEAEARGVVDREIVVEGMPVRLGVGAAAGPGIAEVVLGSGVVFTLLLGMIVDLAQKARWREWQARQVAERLVAEDRGRRQVELQLKASEERLSLALEAGQVGTFDCDLVTGETVFSPGVWRMLGIQMAGAPRMTQWDSLVHPADAGAVKRDFPRGPRPGFHEAEYRVRDLAGEWRWILERSKAVAFRPDATPRRIAGTFQDITARKQAEEALRTSQAEARKLAAVASITDNWVAITDRDGTVEWVNDSFARQMGLDPIEAMGRALTDLLPPPPGEAAPVGALREAFVRRLPAKVELATLSRVSRHYHLQGEIHPVAGEGGEIVRFIAVLHDMTARIEYERGLRRAQAQAEAATRAKSEFLASMSHEIRTPMNGVIGLARLLLESPLTAEQEDWVRTIRQSGDSLLTVINEILDFSKIESGRMELERHAFVLADCVEESLELFAAVAGTKGLELSYWSAPGVPELVTGDVVRLRQVLVNLVGNAVKFTTAGRVTVEVRPGEAPDELAFTVADTGIGIPQEQVESLFQPFSQGDASMARRFGGTGLGLAICRRLVELMGGRIGVTSRPDEGAVFHFTVVLPGEPGSGGGAEPAYAGRRAAVVDDDPVAQRFIVQVLEQAGFIARCFDSLAAARAGLEGGAAPDLLVVDQTLPDSAGPAAAAALRALYPKVDVPALLLILAGQSHSPAALEASGVRACVVKPLRRQALHERLAAAMTARPDPGVPERTGAAGPAAPPLADRLPLRVLLAEDNPVNKKVALRLLDRLGYKAESVTGGAEAVQVVGAQRFDLVFMDVQMPGMDGLEATRRIRADLPADRQPVIVALTANAIAGDADLCRAAGMDDYVSKPVTPEDIHNVIMRRFGDCAKPSLERGDGA